MRIAIETKLLILFILIYPSNVIESVNILSWSGISWWGLGERPYRYPSYLGQTVDSEKECKYECGHYKEKSKLHDSQIVLFEGQPLSSLYYNYLSKPPEFPQKEVGQFFLNFGFEHDIYFPITTEQRFLDHIDYQMTFKNSSDIPITFACLWGTYDSGRGLESFSTFNNTLPFSKKKKSIAMVTYNCEQGGAYYRNAYVRDLMSSYKVESFGQCMNNAQLDPEDVMPIGVWKNIGMAMRYKTQAIKKHLFVVAFENNNFTDYVSEKVYTALLAGTVPVYMGADNIDKYVPEKSIIKTSDFQSPFKVAEYLNYLTNNETAYNEYFEWKKKPLPEHFVDKYNKCVFYTGECRLCTLVTERIINDAKVAIQNDKFRVDFGEPWDAIQHIRALHLSSESNSCVNIGHSTTAKRSIENEFTFETWLLPDTVRSHSIINLGDGFLEANIVKIGKRMFFEVCMNHKTDCITTDRTFEIQWKHFAFTMKFDEKSQTSEINLYVNGMQDAKKIWPGFIKKKDLKINVGCTKDNIFSGMLDDVTLWSRVLTEREISKSMFKKFRGDDEGLLLYMTFNGGTIVDYSVNKLDIGSKNAQVIDIKHKNLDLNCC
ncbi:hypothetical protein PPL_07980 [Heterostelium album PN500]|uniref:Fucosyltransferase n=1 Tax=Heterostelium pallidum (strain ATCC 26659 / Pp 5 / PN500) TaxID=670386 RepID=D3BHH8_HETP5|nr:hypothetical protein PPL_07980 [Heterostelium album PN500]EFA79155.1 hypothetical protein PPL_07980 [Heterostelium album PN500]|eukprot:XP_020431277.1 hypothetical protein PPL_07980 [Heterostelium album PN500]